MIELGHFCSSPSRFIACGEALARGIGQTAVDPTKPVGRMLARFITIDRMRDVLRIKFSSQ
jgi:hypothetical protein